MSVRSEQFTRQQRRYRNREGESIGYAGTTVRAFSEEVSGAKAGEMAVPRQTYGIFVAMTDPRVFDFSPQDFLPTTALIPPQEGSELTRNAQQYVVTNYVFENRDTDTTGFLCYALRKIWNTTTSAIDGGQVSRMAVMGGVTFGGTDQAITSDTATVFRKSIPAGSVNAEIDLGSISASTLQALCLVSTQPATVKTNSIGSPDETLTLAADGPLLWAAGDPAPMRFITHDLTTLYVTVPGAVDALLTFGAASEV